MTKRSRRDQAKDVELRIEKLKREAESLAKGRMMAHVSPDCPAEVEERFWEQVIGFERIPEVEPFEELVRAGLSLPAPDALEDAALTSTLWRVIDGLALLGMYLSSTDHLSDRELYVRLWNDVLRTPTGLEPDNPGVVWYVDLIGGGSEEDVLLYLKYYADGNERRHWAHDWPNDPLPDHEKPPFDRDRRLPQPYGRGRSGPRLRRAKT